MSNFLDTTAGSTHAVNAAILRYMPPDEAKTQLAICDRLQAAEAEVQRLTPDHAHARQCRTNTIEALVLSALLSKTFLDKVMEADPCYRVSMVIGHLNYYREDHGDVKKRYNIKKAPCRKKVREILMKHNFM